MIDLFGNNIPDPVPPAVQMSMFGKVEFFRLHRGNPAVVLRENGEKASGAIMPLESKKGYVAFTERESGKTYKIPESCCKMTWAADVAILAITEEDLMRNISLSGMFTSCCLF